MAHDSGNATWQNGSSGGTKLNATHLENIENAIDGKADSADLGTAATADTGTSSGNVPLLGTGGVLAPARLGTGTPSSSNFLRGDGTWTAPSGSGDVSGPASSTDGNLAVFDGTDGTAIKDGGAPLAIGTTSSTAKAGDYAPASTDISDASTVGKAVLVATDEAAARTAIGAGTSDLAIGTSGTTAAAGNDSRITGALQASNNLSDVTTVATARGNLSAASRTLIITAKTGSYTLALAENYDHVVEVNSSSATTITVPPNSSVAYPVGTVITICRLGSGSVTIAAGSGVTIRNPLSVLTLRAQYSECSLRKRDTDEWVLAGDLG